MWPTQEGAQIRAAPLIVGAPPDPIAAATARIGHIRRHLAQHFVSDGKRAEFRAEVLALVQSYPVCATALSDKDRATLNMAGVI